MLGPYSAASVLSTSKESRPQHQAVCLSATVLQPEPGGTGLLSGRWLSGCLSGPWPPGVLWALQGAVFAGLSAMLISILPLGGLPLA